MFRLRFDRWAPWHPLLWAGVVAGLLTALGYWAYTPDDAFIHLTFSRNLVTTGTFTFSGDVAVNGSTSPLWNLLSALWIALGASAMVTAKVLGYVSAVATVALASWLMFRIAGPAAGWIVGWVLCCDPWFLRWAVSGLETSMTLALIVASLALLYSGRLLPGCVVAGLLPLARPETALYVILYAGVVVALHGRRAALRGLVLLPLPGLAWAIYAQAAFGSAIPNSVQAKTLNYHDGVLERVVALVKIGIVSHGLLLVVAAGLCVALVVGWRKGAPPRPRVGSLPPALYALMVLWPPLLVAGLIVSGSSVASRYYMPGTVVAYLLVAGWLAGQSRAIRVGLPAVSCAVSLGVSFFLFMPAIGEYARNFNRATVEISDALNLLTGPGDIVAARDVGYLGYYNRSGYTILDLAGLVTPEMLEGDAARDAHVLRRQPRFIVERGGVANAVAEGRSLEQFEVAAFTEAGALRFETAAYLGPPGLNTSAPEWYALYSVDASRMEDVLQLAGVPD